MLDAGGGNILEVFAGGSGPKSVRIAFCKGPDGDVIELFQSSAI